MERVFVFNTDANDSALHWSSLSSTDAVALAPDDDESEAGLVVAGQEQVLSKFRFTATNENMKVNKMQILVVPSSSATATSSASADEVPTVKLYDGATLVGTAPITASGDNSGTAFFTDVNWTISKDLYFLPDQKSNINGLIWKN